jgi:N4-gp56 family major capsid protein
MAAGTETITSGGGPELLKEYWNEKLLNNCRANLVLKDLGMRGNVPYKQGKIVHWMTMFDPSDATTEISEGFDPTAVAISTANQTAALTQYGNTVKVSDKWVDTSIKSSVSNIVERLGENAAKTIDTLIKTTIVSGSTVQYAGTAVARNSIPQDTAFYLDLDELREARRTLENANAPRYSDGFYKCVTHPYAIYDIQGTTAWTEAARYTDPAAKSFEKGVVGDVLGFKVLVTTQMSFLGNSGSASSEVFLTQCLAPEFFGVSDLYDTKTVIKDPAPASALDVYGYYGWKTMFAQKRLDENRGVRIEHVCST